MLIGLEYMKIYNSSLPFTYSSFVITELVFRSVRKITRTDWLRNGPIFYDIEQVHYIFYSGPVE